MRSSLSAWFCRYPEVKPKSGKLRGDRPSTSFTQHGLLRREQGCTAAMMVEKSRMLQVSIFQALEDNLHTIDFSRLLASVMAIADEVDSQLAQQMACYIAKSKVDR